MHRPPGSNFLTSDFRAKCLRGVCSTFHARPIQWPWVFIAAMIKPQHLATIQICEEASSHDLPSHVAKMQTANVLNQVIIDGRVHGWM